MRLYKVDVLEAVEHKAEKHGSGIACPRLHRDFLLKNNSRLFDGYMTALIDYADHIRDAGCKAACLALKSILHRLKEEVSTRT